MRTLPTGIQALIAQRAGIIVHRLYWLSARNRSTGLMEQIGIWSGADHATFTISGEARVYYGAGSFLAVNALHSEQGLTIRRLSVNASPFAPEVQKALQQLDPKLAPSEVHLAFFDPETNNLVADPWRMHKGWIDTINIHGGGRDEQSQAVINLVSNSRVLTRVFPSKRSNESQRKRNGTDAFFSGVGISGTIQTQWGQ